tara:strand:+ start:15764 stop:16519 length:756 start_codon:yes stop_codon:yes gene_type:complete
MEFKVKYPSLTFNNRQLSKKEIRILKDMTTTSGPGKTWLALQNPKYSKFIHEVLVSFSFVPRKLERYGNVGTNLPIKDFCAALFCISRSWNERSRGEDQKLTYRTNRFEETISSTQYRISNSEELGHNFLWIIDMHQLVEQAIPHRSRGYYLNDYLLIAKNKQEAHSLALTIIGGPLGLENPVNSCRLLGSPDFFDYNSHNSNQIAAMLKGFDKDILEKREDLIKAEENQEKANYVSAIISQAGLMINGPG